MQYEFSLKCDDESLLIVVDIITPSIDVEAAFYEIRSIWHSKLEGRITFESLPFSIQVEIKENCERLVDDNAGFCLAQKAIAQSERSSEL